MTATDNALERNDSKTPTEIFALRGPASARPGSSECELAWIKSDA